MRAPSGAWPSTPSWRTRGRAVARAAVGLAGSAYGVRAVVVCGKGNNGGDGLVAARYLRRWGMAATAVLLAEPEAFRGVAADNLARARAAGVRVQPAGRLGRELERADLVVDAIVGTGFRGAPEGAVGEASRRSSPPGTPPPWSPSTSRPAWTARPGRWPATPSPPTSR